MNTAANRTPTRSDETQSSSAHYQRNRDYYDRNAVRYEAASWYYFNRYKDNAVRAEIGQCLTALSSRSSLRVLEIGPGTGYLLDRLLAQAHIPVDYVALEHSAGMARILSDRFADRCASFRVLNRSVNSETAASTGGHFDLIMGSSILHHLPDYETVIPALAHQLTPGGVMYFVREPIHRQECGPASVLAKVLERGYAAVNRILMKPALQRRFWPEKVKAEDARSVAIHMFGDGVSIRPFEKLIGTGEYSLVRQRKYNRRLSATLSYLENAWLRRHRVDLFGNTLFSVIVARRAA